MTCLSGIEDRRRYCSNPFAVSARSGWVVNTTHRPVYPRKRSDTHCRGGWVDLQAVLYRSEETRPTGTGSPDRPVRTDSLYPSTLSLSPYSCNYSSRCKEVSTSTTGRPVLKFSYTHGHYRRKI